jgi:hypothetical protein
MREARVPRRLLGFATAPPSRVWHPPCFARIVTLLVSCVLVVVAVGWARGATVSPPRCSDAGRKGVETGWLPGHQLVSVAAPAPTTRDGKPTYTRMCGPASAVVRFRRTLFWIPGGRCALNGTRDYVVQVGLTAAPPAAPAKSLDLEVFAPKAATVGGAYRIGRNLVIAKIQLPHYRSLDVSGGTIFIGPSRHRGTFALRLGDATRVNGSWNCG